MGIFLCINNIIYPHLKKGDELPQPRVRCNTQYFLFALA